MFHESEEDNFESAPSNAKKETEVDHNRIQRLKRTRHQDQFEEYQEEREIHAVQQSRNNDSDQDEDEPPTKKLTVAEKLMQRMGYTEGTGLGKNKQGISEPVGMSTQRGRTGLGNASAKAISRDFDESWDDSTEKKTIEEYVKWMSKCDDETRRNVVEHLRTDEWMKITPKKLKIDDEVEFCDEQQLKDMLEAKNVFDLMSDRDLREARARANPYETIGSAFFQNRAAMKTANIDKVYDWILSRETLENDDFLQKNPLDPQATARNVDRHSELFYFADVCAGPGGFSEYMLWRKAFYNAKGFGFTLAGKDDFKLNKFCASSSYYFEPYYGVKDNGDVMDPENIDSLEDFIMRGTNNTGVHLMMADGGFSVEGMENLQEILSKRLYLCQFLVSLCIVREGGNFFCKLFDIFTPFSVALIYLMRVCYDDISLHKPHTSRPANSERYIICKGLRKEYSDIVRDYFKRVNNKMAELKNRNDDNDVQEIMPIDIMKNDVEFFDNIFAHNNELAHRQTLYLRKYQSFARNQGQYDKDQGTLREECLKYWMVPNRQKSDRNRQRQTESPDDVFAKHSDKMYKYTDFANRAIVFHQDFLRSNVKLNMTYEEYRFVRTTLARDPILLVATAESTFVFQFSNYNMVDKLMARIPEGTILLVEESHDYSKRNNKFEKNGGASTYRILDAAALNGDNVSELPFEERMKAAEKFCTALTLVNRRVKVGWGRQTRYVQPYALTVAKVFNLNQLDELKEDFEVLKHRGETNVFFTENGHTYQCEGLRFVRNLKSHWQAGWSKSQQKVYAHSASNRNIGSIFEEDWLKHKCIASFWDTAILTEKDKLGIDEHIKKQGNNIGAAVPAAIWKWKNLATDYGISKILEEDDEYKNQPTIGSLKKMVAETDENCVRNRS